MSPPNPAVVPQASPQAVDKVFDFANFLWDPDTAWQQVAPVIGGITFPLGEFRWMKRWILPVLRQSAFGVPMTAHVPDQPT